MRVDLFTQSLNQMLVSSRNPLTDTRRSHILPATWASLTLLKSTHKTNQLFYCDVPMGFRSGRGNKEQVDELSHGGLSTDYWAQGSAPQRMIEAGSVCLASI